MIRQLCLHTPRADCNDSHLSTVVYAVPLPPHAPCRLQPRAVHGMRINRILCLHTPRADCNVTASTKLPSVVYFASTRPVQIATYVDKLVNSKEIFASTRSVQIATQPYPCKLFSTFLCLHTLRADCNEAVAVLVSVYATLPPHAPCRLQPQARRAWVFPFWLCLHTLRADCNGRNAQNCNMHFSERVLSW